MTLDETIAELRRRTVRDEVIRLSIREAVTILDALDARTKALKEWQRDFAVLANAITGGTGASAITEAKKLRDFYDRAALKETPSAPTVIIDTTKTVAEYLAEHPGVSPDPMAILRQHPSTTTAAAVTAERVIEAARDLADHYGSCRFDTGKLISTDDLHERLVAALRAHDAKRQP